MTGAADFLLLNGVSGIPAFLDDIVHWPPLGLNGPAVRTHQLWAGMTLAYRGGELLSGQRGGCWLACTESHHADRVRNCVLRWLAGKDVAFDQFDGRFILVFWEFSNRQVSVVTDAFRTYPVVYQHDDAGSSPRFVASDLRLLRHGARALDLAFTPRADLRSIYHYLNFSYVPNESCIWHGVQKLGAGQVLQWGPAGSACSTWWDASYPADLDEDDQTLIRALHDKVVESVQGYGHGQGEHWGTFLSGGTDSSSISGILARHRQSQGDTPVRSYSIGFDEPGYDELGYAQVAIDAFGLNGTQYRISEKDAVNVLPSVVSAYDEPFGNSSAIGGAICARLAAEQGVQVMIAGDGGDEIFGGNERYLKDKIFQYYFSSPAFIKELGRGIESALSAMDSRWPNKVKNFVRRGSLPNPDRFYTDDSFASEYFDTLLTADFRDQVKPDDSLDIQRQVYAGCSAVDELHRLMYLDLKMTIAANDVVKVVRTTRLAGVGVAFPFLEQSLVDFTGRLPARHKLRGSNKRYLFKKAMATVLPEAIQKKKKQGFGMPLSVWMQRGGLFQDLVVDTLNSRAARERGWFEHAAISKLLDRHKRGAWDYSAELYILTMLELWHQREANAVDAYRLNERAA